MIPTQPSRTAWRVAMRRAVHQLLDRPPVLDDPLAVPILGPETAASLRAHPSQFETGRLSPYMRAFFSVRSRFAEDQLAAARARGVRQYVVLGAGSTRSPTATPAPTCRLRVWEVDLPGDPGMEAPAACRGGHRRARERHLRPDRLRAPDARPTSSPRPASIRRPARCSHGWASCRTSRATAIMTTLALRGVRRPPPAAASRSISGFRRSALSIVQRAVFDALAARVSAAGEPWQTFFDPDDLARELRGLGFAVAEPFSPEAINARYFAGRADGLAVGGMGQLMWAGASPPA